MASKIPLPNGAQVAITKAFAAAVAIASFSNAAEPAVETSAAHGLVAGDVVILSVPGWPRADNKIVRVKSSAATDELVLEGLDTTSTDRFPVGGGVGTLSKVTEWSPIPKITSFERTGGDAKSITSSYLDVEEDVEYLTGSNPERVNFAPSYAPDAEYFGVLQSANDSGEVQALRMTLKSGDTLYWPGQLFFNPSPVTTKDQEMVNNASLARQGSFTRLPKLA